MVSLSPRPCDKAELLKMADPERISLAVSKQVALVGSRSLYEKINNNFKEKRFDAIFAKVKSQNSIFLFYACRGLIFRILGPGLGIGVGSKGLSQYLTVFCHFCGVFMEI